MEIVGHCPHCGAPIYASPDGTSSNPPENVYTCMCRYMRIEPQPLTPYVSQLDCREWPPKADRTKPIREVTCKPIENVVTAGSDCMEPELLGDECSE